MRSYLLVATQFTVAFSSISLRAETPSLEKVEKAVEHLSEDLAQHLLALKEYGQIPPDIEVPDLDRSRLGESTTEGDRLAALEKQVNACTSAISLLPIIHSFLSVDLPGESRPEQESRLLLSIDIQADGTVYLQAGKLAPDSLIQRLRTMTDDLTEISLVISVHPKAEYRHLASILEVAHENGIMKVRLRSRP